MAEGWSVFWDRKIPVGKTWEEMLEEEFASACSLVVVWSKHSVKSKWVREEANEAPAPGSCRFFRFYWMGVLPPLWDFDLSRRADFSDWDGTPDFPLFQKSRPGH